MINRPWYRGAVMACYRGRLVRPDPVEPGPDSVILDGVMVSLDELDALFSEDMYFDWQGVEFQLGRYVDGRVAGNLWNVDAAWVAAHPEIEGDPYNGWGGWFPESDIENLRVVKYDLLAAWRHKKEVGTPAPHGLYAYERPATAEEWVRD